MRLLIAVVAVGLAACGGEEASPKSATPAAAAPTSAAPATAAPAPRTTGATLAERRARFDARPAVDAPAGWPKAWRGLAAAVEGKLVSVGHTRQARVDGAPPAESIRLKIRVFGEDAAVDARLLAALKALGLPGDALPEAPVEAGPERWAVDIARVKGDAPRETEAEITWQRTPPMVVGEKPCKKPAAIDLPAELPAWLDAVTNARSTRRRVLTGFDRTPERLALEVGMLYHNGYALDEGVGHLTALARKRGYTQASGSGSRQTWRHPDGAELSWRSDNDPLALGCSLAGPFLRVAWQDR